MCLIIEWQNQLWWILCERRNEIKYLHPLQDGELGDGVYPLCPQAFPHIVNPSVISGEHTGCFVNVIRGADARPTLTRAYKSL